MNFMGMGIPELGVILLVAFLVLGPAKAIDMAKNAGKVLGDLRRSFGDVTNAMTMETMEQRISTLPHESDSQSQPPPGVPMQAEIPPGEENEEDLEPPVDSEQNYQPSD
ncbi:MAG: twin-arginine translocase TatA/TatE family subunit [Chloroflexota bacterium]|nr:twin-arginine translocase TatA/TatE family subunit [Chloroflexota bacterium]